MEDFRISESIMQNPFYATMGGQKGDMGTITVGSATFEVVETIKLLGE